MVIGYSDLLPKINRLRKKKDIQMVLKQGRIIGSDFLFFKFLKNNLNAIRVAFVVSKKISQKAVVRNKIKRRLREVFRIYLSNLKTGYDLVFFAKRGIEKKCFREIQAEVERLFIKTKLLKKSTTNQSE